MKKAAKLITSVVASAALATAANLLLDGVPMIRKPKPEDVKHVKIEHQDYPNNAKEFSDTRNIELAVALLCYLRTSPIKRASNKAPLITITYTLKDGSFITVSANNSTAWINGKQSMLHEHNTFVKMCTAAFFFQNK